MSAGIPTVATDVLHCAHCGHPVEIPEPQPWLRAAKSKKKTARTFGPRTYADKTCAVSGCGTVFTPAGPNSQYCEAHRAKEGRP